MNMTLAERVRYTFLVLDYAIKGLALMFTHFRIGYKVYENFINSSHGTKTLCLHIFRGLYYLGGDTFILISKK